MNEVTLLTFDRGNIQKIIIARAAYWNPKDKIWSLVKGIEKKIDNARQLILNSFETYSFKLGQTLNQILIQARDNNELRIFELRRKIETFQQTGHEKEVHQIESDIQQRLIMPFSCMTFSVVGAAIGINLKPKSSENEFSLGLVTILAYYVFQSIFTTLVAKESLPLWGMWIPSFTGVGFALTRLARLS
jgi:lipopolysaccharide export system permease protein